MNPRDSHARRLVLVLVLALPRVAYADGPRRVVVTGPQDDAVSARVVKELGAMGFDVLRTADSADCTRRAVAARLRDEGGDAAACSDGDSVAIWVAEPAGPRLRDVVVIREDDPHAREVAAVRAAEIARASVELVEPPAPSQPQPQPPPETREPELAPAAAPSADRVSRPVPPRMTPILLFGGGLGTTITSHPNPVFATRVEVGVHRRITLTARLDLPLDSNPVQNTSATKSSLNVSTGFAGAGISMPFMPTTSLVVLRLGGGFSLLWVNSKTSSSAGKESLTGWSPGGYADGSASLRVLGPVRLVADAAIGVTAWRIVALNGSQDNAATFGRPFGELTSRIDIELP